MKLPAIAVIAVLSMSTLAACGGGASADDFCQQVEASQKYFEQFDEIDADDIGDDEALQMLDDMGDELAKLKAAAPDEISEDAAVVMDFASSFIDAISEAAANADDTEAGRTEAFMEALGTVIDDVDQNELEEAGDRISTYVEEECDLDADFLS